MHNLSAYVTDLLVEYNFVDADKREVCKYGLENLIISFLEIAGILMLSLAFDNFGYTLIFTATLIILRRYTGGYHANTKSGCFAVLITSYLIFMIIQKNMPDSLISLFGIIVLIFSDCIVLRYAPIIHSNKNVTAKEKSVYRKFSIVLTSIFNAIVIIGLVLNSHSNGVLSVIVGLMIVARSMFVAVLKKGGEKNSLTKRYH